MKNEKLKLLLVDDLSLITESLSTFLMNYADDMIVVGTARNGRAAVKIADEKSPDIILMDVIMPDMDGIEAVKSIKQKHPAIKIIMLSTYGEDEYVNAALLAGASGYLLKDISPTELIVAIRALKNNVIQISPEVVRRMVQQKYSVKERQDNESGLNPNMTDALPWLKTLTRREQEIFSLIVIGYDNDQIAEKLNIALQTVKNQISTIYSKLGVKNRFEIIRLANKR